MNNANQTDLDVLEEFFVPHGEEFHDVNCEVDDGVNLCLVLYKEGSLFHNIDPKKMDRVMNKGRQNFICENLGKKGLLRFPKASWVSC